MTIWEFITDPLQYEFMQRAGVVTILAAVVCGLLSCWLVLIGWALMGDAISHAILPGVVLAYALGIPFGLGALAFGFAAVALISLFRGTTHIREDTAIGVVFTTLFALGIVLISVTPSQIDLTHILFGNLLGVSNADLVQVVVMSVVILAVLWFRRHDLTLFAFDPSHAQAIGLRPRLLSALLLGSVAVTAVVALKAVGVVLVVALLITPGAAAYLVTRNFWRMLWLAPLFAGSAAVIGIYGSYYLDTAPGGTIVLVEGAIFVVAWLFGPHQGLLTSRRRARAATQAQEANLLTSGA